MATSPVGPHCVCSMFTAPIHVQDALAFQPAMTHARKKAARAIFGVPVKAKQIDKAVTLPTPQHLIHSRNLSMKLFFGRASVPCMHSLILPQHEREGKIQTSAHLMRLSAP